MSSVIFIPEGVESTENLPGGVVKEIGNEKSEELSVRQDNHQRTFLVKNNDGSLEIFNLVKRTTADLVLPDNRMALITFVDYHKHFEAIPLKTTGLEVIIGKDLSIKDSIIHTMNTIKSLTREKTYRYYILDDKYNIIISDKKIKIPRLAVYKNIGKYLISQVRRQENDLKDKEGKSTEIEKGYITIMNGAVITEEWAEATLKNGIRISEEDEIPLQILSQPEEDSDPSTKETSGESPEETSEEIPKETSGESPEETSEEIPKETSGESPEETSEEIPKETSGESPEETSEEIPKKSPEEITL